MARSAASDRIDRSISEQLAARTVRARRAKFFMAVLLVVIDVAMLFLGFVLGYYAREALPFFPQPEAQPPLLQFVPTVILHVGTIITLFYFNRLYHLKRTFSRFDQARNLVGVVTLGALLANGVQELVFRNTFLEFTYPRSLFFYVWFISLITTVLGRDFHRWLTLKLRRRGLLTDNLLIVGTNNTARDVIKSIQRSPSLGYHIVGLVNGQQKASGKILGLPILGDYPDLPNIIDQYHIAQVIIVVPQTRGDEIVELVTLCHRGNVDVKVFPDILAYVAGDLNVDDLGGTPLLTVRDIALRGWRLSFKRGLDIFGALVGIIFLSPLMLLTAFAIWRYDKGNVFFIQERMGLDGRPFPMVKFRSMRMDADKIANWTVENDPRITPIGRTMRKTNWDEIPQLFNVLLGHMSLVGPRPEQTEHVLRLRQKVPRYMERHREKAGMTGWAQIHGLRGDTSIEERVTYDLWYVENWSLWLDIKIILRTIIQTLTMRSRNAY